MRLIFVRHGRTDHNANGLLQGQLTHSEINDTGIKQAQRVADRLSDEKINIAYVSPQIRARQTADIILEGHSETTREYSDLLKERSYGVFEGKERDVLLEVLKKEDSTLHAFKPDDGESLQEAQKRVIQFYNELLEKHGQETILIVSHGGILSTLYVHLMGKTMDTYLEHHPKNTAVTIIEVDNDKNHTVHVLNDTSHLD